MTTTLIGRGSMATRHLLAELADLAPAAGLSPITFTAGGGVEVAERIRQRELTDVVVLAARAIDELADQQHVIASTTRPAFVSEAVIGVRKGSRLNAPATSDELRELLRGARRIGYSTGPSGKAFVALIEQLGLGDELADRLEQARPGNPVGAMVADGQVDVGIQQLSEMTDVPGVRVLGALPEEHRISSVFVAAVAATSTHPDQAAALVNFITSPRHRELVEGHGMTLAEH